MKRFFTVLAVGLLIAALTVPALAWEFDLKGSFIWRYEYIAQGGHNGFFGPYDAVNPALQPTGSATAANWAAMNGWVGARALQGGSAGIQYGLVTGSDASYNYQRMEFFPEIRINPAVRIRGGYQIGGLVPANITNAPPAWAGFPYQYSVYQNSGQFGAWNPIDTGSWTQLWATAQTPWGIVVIGKRPLGFGIGVQYVESSASSESLAVVAPYGPFRIGLGGYLHRRQTFVNALVNGTAPVFGLPTDTSGARNVSFFDGGRARKPWDHDSERHGQPFVFVTYQSGDLDVGAIYEWFGEHDGPGAGSTEAIRRTTLTRDETLEDGSVYVKYNNGRFFLNSEVAWVRGQVHYQLPENNLNVNSFNIAGGGGNLLAPASNEAWKFGTELGVLCGPSKVSLFFSWVPGPDRRAGIWTNNQTWENVINGSFLGNAQFFRPYSLLMAYQYGGGLNAIDRNGEGFMTDAISYGARVDYAVAANLNTYVNFFYANRLSKGWGWGCLTPDTNGNVVLLGRANNGGAYVPALNNGFDPAGTGLLAAPAIPDDALGWEIGAGVDWKLLEGFQFSLMSAYWEPGNWFKFACTDKTLASTVTNGVVDPRFAITPTAGTSGWAVSPGRGIDPIYMFQGTLLVDF